MNQCPPACRNFFWTAAYSNNRRKAFLISLLSQNFRDFCTLARNSTCSSTAETHWAYARPSAMLIQYCIALPTRSRSSFIFSTDSCQRRSAWACVENCMYFTACKILPFFSFWASV